MATSSGQNDDIEPIPTTSSAGEPAQATSSVGRCQPAADLTEAIETGRWYQVSDLLNATPLRELPRNVCSVRDKRTRETVLHWLAKRGGADQLGLLIEHMGGEPSVQDATGNTPLHDCLRAVHEEGGVMQETKQEKFISVWDTVVHNALIWWKSRQEIVRSAETKTDAELKTDAVCFLRSCIVNQQGLTALQYAAALGLTDCVQVMLATDNVFLRQVEEEPEQPAGESDPEEEQALLSENTGPRNYEIDITGLLPEYSVDPNQLDGDGKGKKGPANTKEIEMKTMTAKSTKKVTAPKPVNSSEKSLVEVVAAMESRALAGALLERVPLITLTQHQWRVYQFFSWAWLVVHFGLMVPRTMQSGYQFQRLKNSTAPLGPILPPSPLEYVIGVYAVFILVHMHLWFLTTRTRNVNETLREDAGICSLFTVLVEGVSNNLEMIIETSFVILAFLSVAVKLVATPHWVFAGVEGFFLLCGWFMMLIPLRIYRPIHQIISVMKHVALADLFPWGILYCVLTIGFASGIQLQVCVRVRVCVCVVGMYGMLALGKF